MWKRVALCVTVAWVGLEPERAEARFGKRSGSSSSSSSSSSRHGASPVSRGSSSPGRGQGRPRATPHPGYGYTSPYGYGYGFLSPWSRYYYDPSWAWPYLGAPTPYFGRYYDLSWRRRPRLVPSVPQAAPGEPELRVLLQADGGMVAQGFSVGLGLRMEGERLGFGARMNLFDLATDDGTRGRDTLTLVSLHPSVALVTREALRVRVSGGLDVAFAPDAIFVGPGVGTSAELRLVGPLKAEASAQWTPVPFTQLSGDAGLAVDVGVLRLRAGYRTTYLSDQGRLDPAGVVHRDLLAGPYAGMALRL